MRPSVAPVFCLLLATANLAAQTPTPHQAHDLIAAFIAKRTPTVLPPGDTLVSWYDGKPILFHLYRSAPDSAAEVMIRADAYLGTASVHFRNGRPDRAVAGWSRGDSTPVQVQVEVTADSVVIVGTTRTTYPIPPSPWFVADYGMEDLAVPVLAALPLSRDTTRVLAYRPFAAKWDLLAVTRVDSLGASVYRLVDDKGTVDWWLVADPTRGIVRMRRSGQRFERRPLEETPLWATFERLRGVDAP